MKTRQSESMRELYIVRGDEGEGKEQSSIGSKIFGEHMLVSS